jgi:hypothetical protein
MMYLCCTQAGDMIVMCFWLSQEFLVLFFSLSLFIVHIGPNCYLLFFFFLSVALSDISIPCMYVLI